MPLISIVITNSLTAAAQQRPADDSENGRTEKTMRKIMDEDGWRKRT